MHYGDALGSSIQSILSHKLRSFLTLLGIIIGVMAVVTMFSSVYAIQALIQKNMEGLGWNNSLIITPAMTQPEQDRRLMQFRRTPQSVAGLNYEDYIAIRDNTRYRSIYGMLELPSLEKINNKDIQVRIRATNPQFFITKSYAIGRGRYFSDYEEQNSLPVAVLGHLFVQEHFGGVDPVGRVITLSSHRFRVVGVLAGDALSEGNGMNFNSWEQDEDLRAVYIPLRYGAQYLSPTKIVNYIYVQAHSELDYELLKTEVRQLMLARHNMYPNFSFQDIGAVLFKINEEIDNYMRKWNITLSAIASISLIVGGIGLFSTLLISIQERMLEIGVRKSIGATEKDIFFYFILEALTLALIGAFLGIAFAWLALSAMSSAIKVPLYLPYEGVTLGILFSCLIGFVSGLYPALKASRIDPIQAIYYAE